MIRILATLALLACSCASAPDGSEPRCYRASLGDMCLLIEPDSGPAHYYCREATICRICDTPDGDGCWVNAALKPCLTTCPAGSHYGGKLVGEQGDATP